MALARARLTRRCRAIRSLPGRDVGTQFLITHTSEGLSDGIAPVSPWSPLEDRSTPE